MKTCSNCSKYSVDTAAECWWCEESFSQSTTPEDEFVVPTITIGSVTYIKAHRTDRPTYSPLFSKVKKVVFKSTLSS